MTSVPPEPPAGSESSSTPPTPPAQQWSAPPPAQPAPGGSGGGGGFDPASVNKFDWGVLAAGLLAFIFSFVSYYTASSGPYSASINAWHGFFGWFAMLVALLASGLLAVHIFAPSVSLPVPLRLTVLGGYAVSVLCVILAGLIDGASVPSGVSSGRGAGYYLSLIVILAGGVLSFLRLRDTGGKLPWDKS
jgi:hypothetical protein